MCKHMQDQNFANRRNEVKETYGFKMNLKLYLVIIRVNS